MLCPPSKPSPPKQGLRDTREVSLGQDTCSKFRHAHGQFHATKKSGANTQRDSFTMNSAPHLRLSRNGLIVIAVGKKDSASHLPRYLARSGRYHVDRLICSTRSRIVEWSGGDNEREQRSTLPRSLGRGRPVGLSAELNALFHGQTNFRLQRRPRRASGVRDADATWRSYARLSLSYYRCCALNGSVPRIEAP